CGTAPGGERGQSPPASSARCTARGGAAVRVNRMPAILDRVPRPLLALWGVLLVVTLAWALFLPPWQSPDESQHFAYVQSVAERFALPGDRTRKTFSTEQGLADNRSRTGREGRLPGAEWQPAAFAA